MCACLFVHVEKRDEAMAMGATDYLVSTDEEAMAAATG